MTQITISTKLIGCAAKPLMDSGAVQRRPSVDSPHSIRERPAFHPHGKDFCAYSVKWKKMAIGVGNGEGHRLYRIINK